MKRTGSDLGSLDADDTRQSLVAKLAGGKDAAPLYVSYRRMIRSRKGTGQIQTPAKTTNYCQGKL